MREPDEIFTGILGEGEEVLPVSGSKLCRKVVHRELVIELIGVDPYKFTELRGLGLINSDRKLALEAMTLFMSLDRELREARADWNQDRFRRLMRLRPRVVARLRRRWEILNPRPSIPLATLRRRYHANLAGHLHE